MYRPKQIVYFGNDNYNWNMPASFVNSPSGRYKEKKNQ